MDDLLALIDHSSPVDSDRKSKAEFDQENSSNLSKRESKSISISTHHNAGNIQSHSNTIDPLTKIRIVDRKISKVDLSELVAHFSFSTTAVLASMSNQKLSSILLPNSNYTTMSGRTCAATMGIIFKNSKTRISKTSGRAFTILTIGDLQTGPSVTMMLFGQAYAKFTTTLRPGHVVAFVGMTLMPMRDNYGKETRISFSVNDVDQVVLVGKSLDYGICAGRVVVSSGEGRSCNKYVDLRSGKYCPNHANQGRRTRFPNNVNVSSSSQRLRHSSNNQKGKLNSLQLLKAERAGKNLFRNQMLFNNQSNLNSPRHHCINDTVGTEEGIVSVRENCSKQIISLKNVPRHMTKLESNVLYCAPFAPSGDDSKNIVNNPYAKRISEREQGRNKLSSSDMINEDHRIKRDHCQEDVLAQALRVPAVGTRAGFTHPIPKLLPKALQKKRKYIQPFMDGQVSIPQPNPLFNSRRPKSLVPKAGLIEPSPPYSTLPSPQEKASVLKRQKTIAHQMRMRKLSDKIGSKTESINNANSFGDLLGMGSTLNDSQRTKVLQTKSKYETEANAQLVAKKRAYLNELEKKEITNDKRKTKKGDVKNSRSVLDSNIVSIWTCINCKRTTRVKPGICIRQSHNVKRKREIKKKETTVEKRIGLKAKSTTDGGLVVGAGLEWSGWKGCL